MFFQKYKKIILLIILLIVLFVLYVSFFGKEPESEELLTSSVQTTPAQIVGTEIVAALNQIESLNLSRDIFEDPVFQSLIDRSETIPLEPVGKTNPFAPIGSTLIRSTTDDNQPTNTFPKTNTIINTTNKPANQPAI